MRPRGRVAAGRGGPSPRSGRVATGCAALLGPLVGGLLVGGLLVGGLLRGPSASAAPPEPVVERYLAVMYRYPNEPDKVLDLTPFEMEAYLGQDASAHFREITHGHEALGITVHPEVLTLTRRGEDFQREGLDQPRAQDAICVLEDRSPCSADNLALGPRGLDLSPYVVNGRLRLILIGSAQGGARRAYDMHAMGQRRTPMDVVSWGIDDSPGESGSYAAGWKTGAEEVGHHLLTVHDYYSDAVHRRPIWTRPDGQTAERDHATGWAKTEWSWIHPTPWDKRVRRHQAAVDKRSYWRLGSELKALKRVAPGGSDRVVELTLRPAEITPERLAADECQGILVPFDDADLAAPDLKSTEESDKDAPFHGYIIEHRRRIGADEPILAEGVVVWIVKDKLTADGPLAEAYGDLMHHKGRAMVMANGMLDLERAPFGPSERFVDEARGFELEVLAAQDDPGYGLRVRVTRRAERAPDVAIERFEVRDPGGDSPLRVEMDLSSTVDVRGVRMALQMRVDSGDQAGEWLLVRYGVINVDAGATRPSAFPYPKRFRDAWSGKQKDTKPYARLRGALATAAGGARPVRVDWRLIVWHEADVNRSNDTSVFTSTVSGPLTF